MEYEKLKLSEEKAVDNLFDIWKALNDRLRKASVSTELTTFQQLQLAAQIQHNMFVRQANFEESEHVPGLYETPASGIASVLVDIHTQLENIVSLMEQKRSD